LGNKHQAIVLVLNERIIICDVDADCLPWIQDRGSRFPARCCGVESDGYFRILRPKVHGRLWNILNWHTPGVLEVDYNRGIRNVRRVVDLHFS